MQRVLVQLYRAANEPPSPFVDHHGTLRDARTGRPINGYVTDDEDEEELYGEASDFMSAFPRRPSSAAYAYSRACVI